jgi:hypothetical protein
MPFSLHQFFIQISIHSHDRTTNQFSVGLHLDTLQLNTVWAIILFNNKRFLDKLIWCVGLSVTSRGGVLVISLVGMLESQRDRPNYSFRSKAKTTGVQIIVPHTYTGPHSGYIQGKTKFFFPL